MSDKQEIEGQEEEEEVEEKNQISNFQAFFHLAKAIFGTGILSLPYGFKFSGYLGGAIGMFSLAIICSYAMVIMVEGQIIVKEKRNIPFPTYERTMEYALEDGPDWSKKLSKCARIFVIIVILVHQVGVSIIYYQFCAKSLKLIIETNSSYNPQLYAILLALVVPFLILMLFKNTKYLFPLSLSGNICFMISVFIVLGHMCQNVPSLTERSVFAPSILEVPLFIGTVQYAYTAIGVILPVVKTMKTPENLTKFWGAWNVAVIIAFAVYVTFGMVGYLKYGDRIKEVIILVELLPKEWTMTLARIFCMYALSINFPLNGLYFVHIMMDIVKPFVKRKNVKTALEWVFRFLIVAISVSILLPTVILLIDFVSNVCIPFAIFLFPAWLDYLTHAPDNYGKFKWRIVVDVCIGLFSLIVFGVGTWKSIEQIIKEFGEKD